MISFFRLFWADSYRLPTCKNLSIHHVTHCDKLITHGFKVRKCPMKLLSMVLVGVIVRAQVTLCMLRHALRGFPEGFLVSFQFPFLCVFVAGGKRSAADWCEPVRCIRSSPDGTCPEESLSTS